MAKKRNKADAKVEQAKKPEKSMIARMEERPAVADPEPPINLLAAGSKAGWENGLKGDLHVTWSVVRYPARGYGWVVTIQELSGRQRSASQRFNEKGEPTFYSLDSGGGPV